MTKKGVLVTHRDIVKACLSRGRRDVGTTQKRWTSRHLGLIFMCQVSDGGKILMSYESPWILSFGSTEFTLCIRTSVLLYFMRWCTRIEVLFFPFSRRDENSWLPVLSKVTLVSLDPHYYWIPTTVGFLLTDTKGDCTLHHEGWLGSVITTVDTDTDVPRNLCCLHFEEGSGDQSYRLSDVSRESTPEVPGTNSPGPWWKQRSTLVVCTSSGYTCKFLRVAVRWQKDRVPLVDKRDRETLFRSQGEVPGGRLDGRESPFVEESNHIEERTFKNPSV